MNEHKTALPHQITIDQPLPGFYPCLTLQLNVTRYASGSVGRFVLVVREPSAGIEIRREFCDSQAWSEVVQSASRALTLALGTLEYLQDGEKG
uniref:Uncharacterized protein n=1 Tax=uncultured prokaryote TaxID=198431 RepID=A0A0H5Q5B3_9ZZZZ|nr:hypothetical protein [uncultured prokaryote]